MEEYKNLFIRRNLNEERKQAKEQRDEIRKRNEEVYRGREIFWSVERQNKEVLRN